MARPRGSIPRENRWLEACVIADRFNRPLGSLRVSVTDRCNLRCRYCMPEQDYVWLPKQSILTFEEITRLVGVFASLGAHKVRLTGGEPLLRHDLPALTQMLVAIPGVRDLALTTNGLLLAKHAAELRRAGLGRVTVSLDTLRPERMLSFAKSARHADVLAGIAAAGAAGFDKLKINSVVVPGFNDDELVELIRDTWQGRTDRGAEERLGVRQRGALYPVESLRADPHREMHTRGG